jgi:hypothetical protein
MAAVASFEDHKPREEPAFTEKVVENSNSSQSWIRRNDDLDPVQWLASKEASYPRAAGDAAVLRIRKAFEAAAPKFLESDRMVANRTAQLLEMLAKDGKPESAAGLIEELSSVVDRDRPKETYGELCQYYYILRHTGVEADAATAQLRARCGSPPASAR